MIIKDEYKEPNIFDEMKPEYMTLKQLKSIYTANADIQTGTEATVAAAGQAFKQNLKETIFSGLPAAMGQLAYKAGEKIKETAQIWKERFFDEDNQISPNGGEVFNGNTLVEIGNSLQESGKINIRTANRNLQMLRDDFRKNSIPISREEQDSLLYSVASQALDYPVQLGLAYLNPTLSIGYMAARVLGGETVEGMDKYTEDFGDIVGFEQKSGEELGLNVANAVVQSVWERAFGAPAQLRNFMNSKGMLKLFGRGFTDEFATENLQNLTDAVFDDISDRLAKNETVASRLAQNFRDTVVAGVFGGTSGTAFAIHNRSKGIEDIANNLLGESVPANERQAVATAIYENGVNTLQGLITAELETSSSLRAHHGEVYQAMFDNVLRAVRDAKQIGAFATLDESELARYANTESKRFADQVLAEATMRKKPVTEVFNASDVSYENGKLSLKINGINTDLSGQDIAQGALGQSGLVDPEKYYVLPDDIKSQKLNILTFDNTNIKTKEDVEAEIQRLIDKNTTEETQDGKTISFVNAVYKKGNPSKRYKVASHIAYSSKKNQPEIRNNAVFNINDLIKNSVFVEEDTQKQDKRGYDKALRFYTAVRAGNEIYPVRIVALHKADTDSFDLSGNVYDVIFEEKEQGATASLPNKLTIDAGSLPDTISISDLLQSVKSSDGRTYLQESLDIAVENAALDKVNPAYEGETININGVERTVYNSNGDRIAMSEPALRNFYKWFGDSKVVDEQGRPLVVYHGTRSKRYGRELPEFDVFSRDKLRSLQNRVGFFFGETESFAKAFGDRVMPVYLKMNNPKIYKKGTPTSEELALEQGAVDKATGDDKYYAQKILNDSRKYTDAYDKFVMDIYHKSGKIPYQNRKDGNFNDAVYLGSEESFDIADTYTEKLQEDGFDGVIILNTEVDANSNQGKPNTQYVVFNPNQIKSTSNRGTYSESDNIYLQSAFAGSPVDYDKPSLEAIGSGEGNQAHGYGLYYALSRDVAEGYRERSFARKSFTEVQSLDQEFDKVLVRGQPLLDVYDIDIDRSLLETLLYKPYGVVEAELEKRINQWTEFLNKDDYPYKKYAKDKIDAYTRLKDDLFNNGMSLIKQDVGQVHEVDIPENPYLLDEDLTFDEQPAFVKEKLKEVLMDEDFSKFFDDWGSAAEFAKVELDDYAQGMTGGNIYDRISDMLGSDRAASTILEKHGIKGITYVGDIDGRCFVIFNPDDVKVIQKFYQDGANDPKGANASINILGDTALISLFKTADAHSLPHELSHYWLDAMFKYVKSGNATPEYMERWNAIAKYLNIRPEQESLTRKQQELWATGYETYLNTQIEPTPVIRGLFDDYNRWLQRVYRELKSNPQYTDKYGKKHNIKLTDEIIEVFNSMTTGEFIARPDVERIATKVTPKLEKAVIDLETKGIAEIQKMENATTYPSTVIKPTKAIRQMVRGEAEESSDTTSVSSVAMRELGEAFGYQKKNLAEEYAKAEAWVRGNLARAKEVVYGKAAPDGLLSTAINIAYVREMENMGNYVEAQKATRARSFEQTLRGQEIAMERVTTDDALSMSYWTGKILARKENTVANKFFKNDVQALRKFIDKESKALAHELKGKSEDEKKVILTKKLQELSRQYGGTTLYQSSDELPDTYDQLYVLTRSMIEDSIGITISDDQTNEISSNVEKMKKMFENSASKNGNPSIETFKKLDEMNKLIDSYSPTSQGVVWSSIYGRSAMLASLKSPTTNIISNAENTITEKIARMAMNVINGQTNDNLVSHDKIKDYIKWSDDVYAASGYMPTVTENIFEETPKTLGENRPHSQGKGVVRQVGRIAENLVFKQLMGRPDNFAKSIVFTDVAGNKATQIAYEEGLTGEDAVSRANDLFDDAILLNPQTEQGQQIRKQAMEAAHQTTYTQDSKLAQVALRIRDVLNTVGGKNWKMGDMLMPFVKTPANVVSAGLDYAIGGIYTLYNVKEIIQNPKSDVSQKAIRSAVRNGEGVLLALLLSAFLDEDDYIPEFANLNPKMREMVKLKGGVYNSIRLFGHWVSLDYFGTLGVPIAGIMKARQREGLFNSLFAYGQGTIEQLLKVPGFREAADVIGNIQEIGAYDKQPEEVWKEVFDWTTDQVYTRSVPAFVNDIGKFIDTYERETNGEMIKRIQSKIPFLREELPVKTSIGTGGKVETEGWKALLFGSRVSEDNDNRIVNEVEKLMKQGVMPSVSDPTKYGKLKTLSDSKKNQARAYFNTQYAKEVKKIINKPGYARMKPEDKKKAFDKVRRELTEELKKRYRLL